jgi:hypothetical protein
MLDQEKLKQAMCYDPETGVLTWRIRKAYNTPAGSVAGKLGPDGYRQVSFDLRMYMAHRLAWLYVHGKWPVAELDHINGKRDDNRIANLREASRTKNNHNRRADSFSHSGIKGVQKRGDRWRARITVDGKSVFLGSYRTPEEARESYGAAAQKYFGEFARTTGLEKPVPCECRGIEE